jgi:hypothetical protein
VKLMQVLARDPRHLQLPESGAKIPLHNVPYGIQDAWLVVTFHVLRDVAVEKIIDRRCRPKGLARGFHGPIGESRGGSKLLNAAATAGNGRCIGGKTW